MGRDHGVWPLDETTSAATLCIVLEDKYNDMVEALRKEKSGGVWSRVKKALKNNPPFLITDADAEFIDGISNRARADFIQELVARGIWPQPCGKAENKNFGHFGCKCKKWTCDKTYCSLPICSSSKPLEGESLKTNRCFQHECPGTWNSFPLNCSIQQDLCSFCVKYTNSGRRRLNLAGRRKCDSPVLVRLLQDIWQANYAYEARAKRRA